MGRDHPGRIQRFVCSYNGWVRKFLKLQLVPERDTAAGGRAEPPPVVHLNFQKVRTELPDEDIRSVALSKLRDIVLQDPLATQIGTGIHNILNGGGACWIVMALVQAVTTGRYHEPS